MSPSTYNNAALPSMMYGTAWKEGNTARLVELAVKTGFTAIDTANQLIHYQEAMVGDALLKLYESGVKRESLFLQTKFTSKDGQDHRTPYDAKADLTTQVNQSFKSSLEHLHTDYLDSYVLHGPHSRRGLLKEDWEVWRAMEALFESGKTKIIGVSNVNADQLSDLCATAKVKPMVVQNRCYAQMGWDYNVRQICKKEGIIYQGFSLLTANVNVVRSFPVRRIAERLGATPAQVIFTFSMQIGMLPLTGTTNEQHMKEDLQSDKFELVPAEIDVLEQIAVA